MKNDITQLVIIGEGNIFNKGVYANRDFKKGEIVIKYNLKQLSQGKFKNLSDDEKHFVHTHFGMKYLYGIPERYVNDSLIPNTFQDLVNKCDIASRDIKIGEQITTDSSRDDV